MVNEVLNGPQNNYIFFHVVIMVNNIFIALYLIYMTVYNIIAMLF